MLNRTGSWLLIYLSVTLGYWLVQGHREYSWRTFGDTWIQPGTALILLTAGMLIVGVYLFFLSHSQRHLISFISGFAVIGLLLGSLLFDDEGILAFSLGILTLMPLGLGLKLIQKVLGVALPFWAILAALVLLQVVLIYLYFRYRKKIHWGFVAVKLGIVSVAALFCFYPHMWHDSLIPIINLLNIVWLAEAPWIWVDIPAKRSSEEKRELR